MAVFDLYKVTDVGGFTPQIGRLVSMMNYVRHTTLEAVEGLTTEQLDYLPDALSNSIGALLFHMGAVEFGFQVELFEHRLPNEREVAQWGAAYELGNKARQEISGYPLSFYLNRLAKVRRRTLAELKERNDSWLDEEHVWDGHTSNHHFIWFHVFEDEINHRGQIRVMRKRLPL